MWYCIFFFQYFLWQILIWLTKNAAQLIEEIFLYKILIFLSSPTQLEQGLKSKSSIGKFFCLNNRASRWTTYFAWCFSLVDVRGSNMPKAHISLDIIREAYWYFGHCGNSQWHLVDCASRIIISISPSTILPKAKTRMDFSKFQRNSDI